MMLQIILETIDSTINQALLERYFSNHIFIKVWDISSTIGIPAFHCAIQDSNILRDLPTFRGAGANIFNPSFNGSSPISSDFNAGSRDDIFFNHYRQQLAVD